MAAHARLDLRDPASVLERADLGAGAMRVATVESASRRVKLEDGRALEYGRLVIGSYLIAAKGIRLEPELALAEVDPTAREIRSYDDRAVPCDLLASIPVHGGASCIEESGLGNELGFVPTHPQTL